ncbi:MAG: hypothetical protein AB8H03_05090 [Saprospiraceae bacterium]
MIKKASFEFLIRGTRDEQLITPYHLDIDEVIQLLSNAKDLLFVDEKGKRPNISTKMEEGSIRLILTTAATIVIQTHALLEEVKLSNNLSVLHPKQQSAIQYFEKIAQKDRVTIQIGNSKELNKGLFIDHNSSLENSESVWIPVELYVTGEVVNIGGKSKSNIHLDTKEFGMLIIKASKEMLLNDDQNRVYKTQEVRIKVKQNIDSGEYDIKSAKIIEFIDNDLKGEKPDEYLDRLIQKASSDWKNIENTENWLKKVRGYED